MPSVEGAVQPDDASQQNEEDEDGGTDTASSDAGGSGNRDAGGNGERDGGSVAPSSDGGTTSNGISVQISPANISLLPSDKTTFSCTVSGSTNRACSFAVTESNGGSITDSGAYTAPGGTGTYHVVATSKADSGASATATIIVRTVAACSGGGGKVGVWENVSPAGLVTPSNQETFAVVVDPVDSSVYAAAGNITNNCGGNCFGTGVYKSSDCGASWNKVSTGTNAKALETGDPWAMMIDPANPKTLYINNGYGSPPTIFRSKNGGVDWDLLDPDPDNMFKPTAHVQAMAMDPTNSKHIALTFHDSCTAPHKPFCLASSTDGGDTWKIIEGAPEVHGWEEAATVSILGPNAYMTAGPSGAFYTGDSGKTWKKIFDGVIYASYAGSTHLTADGTLYFPVTGQGVFSSKATATSALGEVWTRIPNGPGQSSTVITDGVTLYASNAWNYSGKPVYSMPLNNVGTWTEMDTNVSRGAYQMAYDSAHSIIYAANMSGGVWRLRTR